MPIPALIAVANLQTALQDNRFDAVVVVGDAPDGVLSTAQANAAKIDARVGKDTVVIAASVPGGRMIHAPTGPLDRDYDDGRRIVDAARAGVVRARDAGARQPLLVVGSAASERFPRATELALLGATTGLWEPLEAREAHGEETLEPVVSLGFIGGSQSAERVGALELGRRLARDLCGTEPERMRAEKFAETCVEAFAGTDVAVDVVDDMDVLRREYPLLMAVGRASMAVERHRPRVVRLEWTGPGETERTYLFAGKGVTYDTGGADIKYGGAMAGMSRDKGGAAAVAGLVLTLSKLAPPGVKIVAELGLVRNSVGADSFVTDEIIPGHSGVRVRVGNTDAEGRLVLADCLSHCRTKTLAEGLPNPHVLSVATLTGHAVRAVGPYSIAMDNGPARAADVANSLDRIGEQWGDPFEISFVRREDFDFVRPRTRADDVISCNNAPSSATARGHQFPGAFLAIASGLADHGNNAEKPVAFTHVDIGGSGAENSDWQHGRPTAAPVVAMAAWIARLE